MPVKFVPNPHFLRELARSPEAQAAMKLIADQVADEARRLAPVQFGDYREQIETDAGEENGKPVGRVVAAHFTSGLIEFGTGTPGPTPAFAPLRKAGESVVGPVRENRR